MRPRPIRSVLMLLQCVRSLTTFPAHAYAKELNAAVSAVRRAARITTKLQRDLANVESATKDDASPVTVADVAAQCVVIDALSSLFPDDGFVAEESAADLLERGERRCVEAAAAAADVSVEELCSIVDTRRPNAKRWWVLDPIDGTKGFMRGAQYCTALSLIDVYEGDYEREAVVGVLGCPNLERDGSLVEDQMALAWWWRRRAVRGVGRRPTLWMTGRRSRRRSARPGPAGCSSRASPRRIPTTALLNERREL